MPVEVGRPASLHFLAIRARELSHVLKLAPRCSFQVAQAAAKSRLATVNPPNRRLATNANGVSMKQPRNALAVAVVTLAGVIAYLLTAAGQADENSAAYVTKIPRRLPGLESHLCCPRGRQAQQLRNRFG
jgi:hypothetical protein